MGLVRKINQASVWSLVFIICLLGFLVYANSLFNSFVWDDEEQIVKNVLIQDLRNLPKLFTSSTFHTGGTGSLSGWYYKPLMMVSYMINFSLWGTNPAGYHLFQVLLHLINSVLVFLILFSLFKNLKTNYTKTAAFFAALIFAVHPVNVEAVSYLASTQEVLYTFFSLLAFFVYLKKKNFWASSRLGLPFIFLGLLSKESAVVVIPVIFFYLFLFRQKREAFYFLLFSFFCFAIYIFLRVFLAHIPFSVPHLSPIGKASFNERLYTIPFILFNYLRLLFYPKNLSIAHHEIIKSFDLASFYAPFFVILVSFAIIVFYLFKKKRKLYAFFFLWFISCLFLVLNLFPLDMTYAERWLYFGLIGFLGLLASLVLEIKIKALWLKNLFWLILIGVVSLLSARTIARNFNWQDGLTLFSHDVAFSKDSFDLENNLGVELFRVGKIEEAKAHFERSIRLAPDWWTPYNNLGAYYNRKGEWEKAHKLYQKSIENGDYYLAYENLASLKLAHQPLPEATAFIEEAVGKLPQNARLRQVLALAYWRAGEKEKALKQAKVAFSLEPSEENYRLLLAILQGEKL